MARGPDRIPTHEGARRPSTSLIIQLHQAGDVVGLVGVHGGEQREDRGHQVLGIEPTHLLEDLFGGAGVLLGGEHLLQRP